MSDLLDESQEQYYSRMVAALVKPGEQLVAEINPFKANLNHMTLLLCGEVGELADAIKKHTMYDKDIDFMNVIEELGDIEFALEAIRQELTINREETLAANVDKLSARYTGGKFTNEDAQQRADKQPELIGVDLAEGTDETIIESVEVADHEVEEFEPIENTYIGTKAVIAIPMTLGEYYEYRGSPLIVDESTNNDGYLVEYTDGGKPNDDRHEGYISWSPKEQFENAYQNIKLGVSFGHALDMMKSGFIVRRKGWLENDDNLELTSEGFSTPVGEIDMLSDDWYAVGTI